MDNIWVVSCWDPKDFKEPTVTVFNNSDSANNCSRYFEEIGYATCVDKCEVYSLFRRTQATE